jgi:hypothetical protein
MKEEEVVLVFADGFRFTWHVEKLREAIKVARLAGKHGDPVEIIGDGQVAQTLRQKYEVFYNQNPERYNGDIFGTASMFSEQAKEDLKEKFGKIRKKIKL